MNHIDISPNYAGTLMGLTNGAANIMSIIAPLLVGFIVHDQSDTTQWRYVFFISAGIYFFGNLLFIIFSKTDVQPWNDPTNSERRKEFVSNFFVNSNRFPFLMNLRNSSQQPTSTRQ